jgi:hypothetical protein
MKTNIFSFKKATLYSLFGFLSVLATSCGSYQNSSYYDSDGIYGNSPRETQTVSSTQYKNYFSSLQETNTVANDSIIVLPKQGYTETNIINVYNDPWNVYNDPWNMSFGMGWGMGWGYAGWGWGYPGWGWGYPGWGYPGWGYPSYGYNNNYSYNSSRRGSSYASDVNRNNRYSQNQSYNSGNSNSRRGGSVDARNNSSFMTADYSQNNSNRTRGNSSNNSSRGSNYSNNRTATVSYTHLTLPTKP